jgi:hypothetical protein
MKESTKQIAEYIINFIETNKKQLVNIIGEDAYKELSALLEKNIKPFAAMVRHKAIEYVDHFLQFLSINAEETKCIFDIVPQCNFDNDDKTVFKIKHKSDTLEITIHIDKKIKVVVGKDKEDCVRQVYPSARKMVKSVIKAIQQESD